MNNPKNDPSTKTLLFLNIVGEFGSERLVQRVVDTILAQTAVASRDDKMEEGEPSDVWSSEQASKIILTGHKVISN